MNHKQLLGRRGEAIAARCLRDQGLHLIERNWRCARGEIDIIACQAAVVVFCEVKTRSSMSFGQPAEAVTAAKAARLRALAARWLAEHPGRWDEIRFDVVCVLITGSGAAEVEHIRCAF